MKYFLHAHTFNSLACLALMAANSVTPSPDGTWSSVSDNGDWDDPGKCGRNNTSPVGAVVTAAALAGTPRRAVTLDETAETSKYFEKSRKSR